MPGSLSIAQARRVALAAQGFSCPDRSRKVTWAQMAPMIRKLCKTTGFKLKEIYDLFPSGPAKGARKVAGLPKPTGCV